MEFNFVLIVPKCIFPSRYFMYGDNVYLLRVSISDEHGQENIVFEKEGNYGNNWNYGQVTLNETSDFKVC